jgi:protein TonB
MSAPRSGSVSFSVLDAYPIRIMLGLVASLSLLLALVHLPVQSPTQHVGWSTQSPTDRIVLSEIDSERSPEDPASEALEQAPPATKPQLPRSKQAAQSRSPEDPTTGSSSGNTEDTATLGDARSVAVLGTADRRPQLVGGMGSLYLNINYPAKARKQGIEGRLELEFIVETDGSVSDITIAESLHPLCDSAAVKGLRSVEFVPAKHNGDAIPIRMELPVRFQLTAVSSSRETNDSDR